MAQEFCSVMIYGGGDLFCHKGISFVVKHKKSFQLNFRKS